MKINTSRRKLKQMTKSKEEKMNPPDNTPPEEAQRPPTAQELVKMVQAGHQARQQLLEAVAHSLHTSTANPARKREMGSFGQVISGLNDISFNTTMDMLKIVQELQQIKAQLFMLSMHTRVIEAALVENDIVTEAQLEAGHQKFQEEIQAEQEKAMARLKAQAEAQQQEQAEAPHCKGCEHLDRSRCQLTENRVDDWELETAAEPSPDWCPLRLGPQPPREDLPDVNAETIINTEKEEENV